MVGRGKVRKNKIRPLLNSVKAIGIGPGVFQRTGPFRFFKRLPPLLPPILPPVRLCNSGGNSPFPHGGNKWLQDNFAFSLGGNQVDSFYVLLFALAGSKWGYIFGKKKCLETFYCHLSILFVYFYRGSRNNIRPYNTKTVLFNPSQKILFMKIKGELFELL